MAEDGNQIAGDLYSLSQKQLVELAKAFNIPDITDSTDKPIIVRNLLRGVGFRYTTQVSRITVNPVPVKRPVVTKPANRQLFDLLKTYVTDEILLLNAVASMLETLMQNADANINPDSETQVTKYATDLVHELEYFQAHTSHARLAGILRILRPPISE